MVLKCSLISTTPVDYYYDGGTVQATW
jgi:hypothetical protein